MKCYTQEFTPAIKICVGEKKEPTIVKTREWQPDHEALVFEDNQIMGYMGQYQIEEVWKYYCKNYYVSNYGYVVKIKNEDKEKANKLFSGAILDELKSENGVKWLDLSKDAQKLICDNTFIPLNRKVVGSNIRVCLNITGKTDEYDIHKIIAKKFLKPVKDANIVHHIDNNSYNNCVTNLIYLPESTHKGFKDGESGKFHPMSYK